MIFAINYCDEKYEKQRKENTKSAYHYGKVDKVIEYYPNDIKDFMYKNPIIFSYKRGAGLWLWKPYIILKTLELMKEGDFLFYCDSGVVYINKIKLLINALEKSNKDIMLFELPLLEKEFTKRETCILMEYDDLMNNQILSGYILLKKNNSTIEFIKKWLEYMLDERLLSPNKFTNINEFNNFIAHREDQSILSILARKEGLEVFRDPSDYGEFPWQYKSGQWCYCPRKYKNSDYPTILLSNRKENPQNYKIKYYVKKGLKLFGLYNERISQLKNRNEENTLLF